MNTCHNYIIFRYQREAVLTGEDLFFLVFYFFLFRYPREEVLTGADLFFDPLDMRVLDNV
jgi:hypothetical protein